MIMGYFKPIMVYFGVSWPVISSHLAAQVHSWVGTVTFSGSPVNVPRLG